MEGTIFKQEMGSSYARLKGQLSAKMGKFPYLLRIKYFHFHDVAEQRFSEVRYM